MKRIISSVFISCFILNVVLPQVLKFESAIGIGSESSDRPYSITVDNFGNIYTTGYFQDTADFDPGPNEVKLISNGGGDIFIHKMDSDNNLLWARSMGGEETDYSYSIAVDDSGNVYTTGFFKEVVDFDPGHDELNFTATGNQDGYIQKLDSSGNLVWVKQLKGANGSANTYCQALSIDLFGNVIITGKFSGKVDFDPANAVQFVNHKGGGDIFILKLDSFGEFLWVKQIGGTSADRADGITTDSIGDIYITGQFSGTVDFDPGDGIENLGSKGIFDGFVQKLDAQGEYVWASQFGGPSSYVIGTSIALDDFGFLYVTGDFSLTVDFDPGLDVLNLIAQEYQDAFVQKMDTSGNLVWVKQLTGNSYDFGISIETDDSDGVYVSGNFEGIIDMDPGSDSLNFSSKGKADIFTLKLDSAGVLVWAFQIGDEFNDYSGDIIVDNLRNVYSTGRYWGTSDFDPSVGVNNLTSVVGGGFDIYIQKLRQVIPSAPIADLPVLPELNDQCSISPLIIPTATNNCDQQFTATTATIFPITTPGTTIIIWNYTDDYGNTVSQSQTAQIDQIVRSVTVAGSTIEANATGYLYQWIDCNNDNVPISGEVDQSFTANSNGSYAVEITNGSCLVTSDCESIIAVGNMELASLAQLVVYPNPTVGSFSIDLGGVFTNVEVNIQTIAGEVLESEAYGSTNLINLEIIGEGGVYFVNIKATEGLSKVLKVIKK